MNSNILPRLGRLPRVRKSESMPTDHTRLRLQNWARRIRGALTKKTRHPTSIFAVTIVTAPRSASRAATPANCALDRPVRGMSSSPGASCLAGGSQGWAGYPALASLAAPRSRLGQIVSDQFDLDIKFKSPFSVTGELSV